MTPARPVFIPCLIAGESPVQKGGFALVESGIGSEGFADAMRWIIFGARPGRFCDHSTGASEMTRRRADEGVDRNPVDRRYPFVWVRQIFRARAAGTLR